MEETIDMSIRRDYRFVNWKGVSVIVNQ